ncbi:MAG: transposase [Anaerolineales bacterium]|nr:transposase [Anaerolineales bacterium]
MTIDEKIIKPKLGLLKLAEQLGNVSQACKIMGYSRDSFYGFKELAESEPMVLTEAQVKALEKAQEQRPAEGQIETEHPGYLGSQDTYYVGTIKGLAAFINRLFIDTYSKVALAKLYDRKNALVAADLLNDRVVPFFEQQQLPLLRILTDRGTEYCGSIQHHEFQLYLAIENIDHSKTKVRSPQSNGICERFHRTIQDEFYQVAFRKKLYTSLDELQADLDEWLESYNRERPHTGKYCDGRTPFQTLRDQTSGFSEAT